MDASIVIQILQAIIGIILIFFLPGFLIDRYFMKKEELHLIERITIIIALSVCITVAIGLILGWLSIFNYWTSVSAYVIFVVGVVGIAHIKDHPKLKKQFKWPW